VTAFAAHPIPAKRLAIGDRFVTAGSKADAETNGWYWVLHEHALTARGDYSSIIGDDDGTTWTERYQPDEPVWLVDEEHRS